MVNGKISSRIEPIPEPKASRVAVSFLYDGHSCPSRRRGTAKSVRPTGLGVRDRNQFTASENQSKLVRPQFQSPHVSTTVHNGPLATLDSPAATTRTMPFKCFPKIAGRINNHRRRNNWSQLLAIFADLRALSACKAELPRPRFRIRKHHGFFQGTNK